MTIEVKKIEWVDTISGFSTGYIGKEAVAEVAGNEYDGFSAAYFDDEEIREFDTLKQAKVFCERGIAKSLKNQLRYIHSLLI